MNIEELENKVSKYEEEINTLKAEIAKLKEEKKPVKRWRAEKDKIFYYLNEGGNIDYEIETYTPLHNFWYESGNYFQTSLQVSNHKEKLLIYQKLKDIALELNNGEKIDWEADMQYKYYIASDIKLNNLVMNNTSIYKGIGQIYCLDKNFLEIAKQRIGEERLKKLFEEEKE